MHLQPGFRVFRISTLNAFRMKSTRWLLGGFAVSIAFISLYWQTPQMPVSLPRSTFAASAGQPSASEKVDLVSLRAAARLNRASDPGSSTGGSSRVAATPGPEERSIGVIDSEFRAWAKRFLEAQAGDASGVEVATGLRLAQERREGLAQEIRVNPRSAIRRQIPWKWRQSLPSEIRPYLEEVVSGRGDLTVYCAVPRPGADYREFAGGKIRYVSLQGRTFKAYLYGRRVRQMSEKDVALHGIAVGNVLALHEDPLRVLEEDEAAAAVARGSVAGASACALCGATLLDGTRATVLDHAGYLVAACSASHGATLNRSLAEAESKVKLMAQTPVGAGNSEPPVPPTGTFGTKRVLYMPVVFRDDQQVQITADEARRVMDEVNDFYVEASYNKTALITTVTPVLTLPYPKNRYALDGPGGILTDASAAAVAAGFDPGSYDFLILRHPNVPGFDWAGLGGGGVAWLQDSSVGVTVHELGHIYGLGHANFWDTRRAALPPNPNNLPFDVPSLVGHDSIVGPGDDTEYGDIFDIMGSGGGEAPSGGSQAISPLFAHFNAIGKRGLGWLPEAAVADMPGSGTNRIYAHDVPRMSEGRLYALRAPKDAQREYWVSVRSKNPTNPWLTNGVELHWAAWAQTIGYSTLLDSTPGSRHGRQDAPIAIGRTYADVESQVYITPVARGGSGVNTYVDVVVHHGPFASNTAPTFTLEVSADRVTVSAPVTFTVSAADAEGDRMAFYWDFGDDTSGPNAAAVTKSWDRPGEYVVRLEVSDMKGGLRSTHAVVTVGNVTPLRASGQVVDLNGQPVANVRIANGLLTEGAYDFATDYDWTYTDTDGRFTLVNLTNRDYTLCGYLVGYVINPLNFSSPITLADRNAENLLFQAVPLQRVSVKRIKDADVVRKQPGTFQLTRVGDTNTEIEVVFMLGGSAEAGADYTDLTNIVSHTNVLPSPFGPIDAAFDFYAVKFATGVFQTNVSIVPASSNAPPDGDRDVALTLMYPLEKIFLTYTNGDQGTLVTNTNVIFYTGWEVRTVNNQDTWFQTDMDYVPYAPAEARLWLKGPAANLPILSLFALDTFASENLNDPAAFVVLRSGLTNLPVRVSLQLGGSAAAGLDYVPPPTNFVIPAGEQVFVLPVTALADYYLEGNETVSITLVASADYTVGTPSAEAAIFDNDMPLVTLTAPDSVGTEPGTDTATALVTRIGDMTQPLVVNYLASGTAVNGRDYRTLSGTVTIPAGQPSSPILVTPRDNGIRDGGNTVELFLSESPLYNVGDPRSVTLRIQDRSLPMVTVTATDATAAEPADNGEFTLTRTGDLSRELSVGIRLAGQALESVDFLPVGTNVVFRAGLNRAVLTLVPLNDAFREDPETVTLALLPSPDYNLGNPSQATLSLGDDDGSAQPAVAFNFKDSAGPEDLETAMLAVSVSANPAENNDVTVDYKVIGGTALPEVDYPTVTATGRLVFPHDPGGTFEQRVQLLEIPTLKNDKLEPDRTLVVELLPPFYSISNVVETNEVTITNSTGETSTTNVVTTNFVIVGTPMNAYFGTFKTHTYTIQDDDNAIVTVSATTPTASEQASSPGVFTLKRAGSTNRAQQVRLQMTGLAGNGADYQVINSTIEIPAGVTELEVPVIPLDDPIQEYLEDVTLVLLAAPGGQIGGESRATVQIVDNDGALEFTQIAYQALEGAGTALIGVRRSGDTNAQARVDFEVTAGTAQAGVDFVTTNGTIVFAPGVTSQSFAVMLVDDLRVEPSKTVALWLRNAADGSPIGGQSAATLTILDDDSEIEFTGASYRANENATNALISLRRLGNLASAASVVFMATNDTAVAGEDFVYTNRVIEFPPGQTNVTVQVRVLDDILFETNETVLLVVSTNEASNVALGTNAVALLAVVDDECALELGAPEYGFKEYARVATVDVRRVGGTVNPVSVSFATTNGTARTGSDYLGRQGTLTFSGDTNVPLPDGSGRLVFQPGETNKTIEISLLDDFAGEGDEDFYVTVSNPKGPARGALAGSTVLGTLTNAIVTILDDETPGNVDFGFNPGLGADGPVMAVALQPDGKIVVGGDFLTFDGVVLNRIARLHEDGYLDSFFNPGAGVPAVVHAVAVQADGRILIGGAFTQVDASARNRVARLNGDGSVDDTFDVGFGASGLVRAIAVAPDGGVVLGGDFNTVDGNSRIGVARLLPDGTVDDAFDPGAGASGGVFAVAVQPDGKVLLGGAFATVGGANRAFIARLNGDGSVDSTFNPGVGPDGAVRALALANDGRIVIGGDFRNYSGVARQGVARVNPDGTLDNGFDPGLGAEGSVLGVAVQLDGKVFAAGAFTNFNGQALNRFVRMNPNGSVDSGFEVGTGANATIRSVAMQPDTAVVIGGEFTVVNGLDRRRVARLHGDEKFVLSTIQFSQNVFRVKENEPEALITVLRSGDIQAAANVDFVTADGSANAGADYASTNGVLRFEAGETVKTFRVVPFNDSLAEGDETVSLTLTNLPPGYSLSGLLRATLIIEDDESAVAFAVAAQTVNEGVGQTEVTVRRTGPTDTIVTVDFATRDGSALGGSDYEAATGTVQFGVGETEKSLAVPVLDDEEPEENEFFLVDLSNPQGGAVLGSQSTATITVVDNDRVEFFSLSITPPVGGTVTPPSGQYPVGSTQLLIAAPAQDYEFIGWEGTTNTPANPLALVMDRNYTLTARFAPTRFTYTFEPPFTAADLNQAPWINASPAAPWQLQSAVASGGRYALRSGVLGDGQSSTLELETVMRAGTVSFDLRVSTEANWDFVEFYLNGVRVQRWSGDVPWRSYQFNVPAGRNRLTWRYSKDANFSTGFDAAFLDNLYLPIETVDPTDPTPRLGIRMLSGGTPLIEIAGKAGVTYVTEAANDLSVWTPISTNTLSGGTGIVLDPRAAGQQVRFYRAYAR